MKTKELESQQERKSSDSCSICICNVTDYFITSEIESLQTIVISKNEQVEELQSKLEKKDEIVKELESIQERKSYVTLQLN